MNGNYSWQKQQANEKIQARQREAQMHRQAKQVKNENDASGMNQLAAFFLFLFLVLVGLLLPK